LNVWAGILGDIIFNACLLLERLIAQGHHLFVETVPPGLLEDEPQGVRQRLSFQYDGASHTIMEMSGNC
jgi:hypothetical protein